MCHKIGAEDWIVKIDLHMHSSAEGRRRGVGSAVPEFRAAGIDEAADFLATAVLESDGVGGVIDAGDHACHGDAIWPHGGGGDGEMPCGEKEEECETKVFHEDEGLRMCGRWRGVFLPGGAGCFAREAWPGARSTAGGWRHRKRGSAPSLQHWSRVLPACSCSPGDQAGACARGTLRSRLGGAGGFAST